MHWFDAHLDLGMLAETGRDMHAGIDDCRGRYQPAAVTLSTLAEGNVRACLGTIFTQAIGPDSQESAPFCYPEGDGVAAWKAGMRQLKLYHAWRDAGIIDLLPRRGQALAESTTTSSAPLRLGILMECADPIETPDQLDEWADQGLIAIGLTWSTGSRYAGGNAAGPGLTPLGRDLATRMDELNIVHDLSHLSQQATADLLAHTASTPIASHSNCRALLEGESNPAWQRHLADETIAEIGRRGGIVGLNLVRNFIRHGLDPKDPTDRPTIDEAINHVEHVCEIMGHRKGVGLGSDLDGGITANDLPEGIHHPRDYEKLAGALRARGWNDDEIHGFAWNNWATFWGHDQS